MTQRGSIARLALLLAGLVLVGPAVAASLPDLAPVSARYRITVNGIPAGTPAYVEIRPQTKGRYEASFRVENRFLRHHELSHFEWNACQVKAHDYQHEFHGLGIDRQSAISFDWTRHVAIESRGENRRELPIEPGVFDGLNMAMLARCKLRDGARALDLSILYRGERKDVHFVVTGTEKVETVLGTFDALVVERRYPQKSRRTRVWVAPALDWFMVRFEHIENAVARGSLLLTDFTIDGKTLPRIKGKHAGDETP